MAASGRFVPGPQWTDERTPQSATEERHARQWKAGRAAALQWVRHPTTTRLVEAARPELVALASPLEMGDPNAVAFKLARLLDVCPVWPDGSRWPNPYFGAPDELLDATARVAPELLRRLHELAQHIEAAGVEIDPFDFGTMIVLAQITLLPIDLRQPARALIPQIHTLPPGWTDREAAAHGHADAHASRYGRTKRFLRDLAEAAEELARELGPSPIHLPYAGGLRRQASKVEHCLAARRTALAAVLKVYPKVTSGRLRATWSAGPSTPGGLLRTGMGRQPHDTPPGESTLRGDLRELRR